MAASARLVVLIDPKEKRKLEADAREANVSVAEIARRRISGERNANEKAFMESLVDLGQRAERAASRFDARQLRVELLNADAERRLRDARTFLERELHSGQYATVGALLDAALAIREPSDRT